MARDTFVTQARAKRVINALLECGVPIKQVTITSSGVVLDTSPVDEAQVKAKTDLPDDWEICPFENPST
jgi:hypothetical protein